MGRDEQKAFELLKKNRKIQKPIIEEYNGCWIKELGDGVLACFNNAKTIPSRKTFSEKIGVMAFCQKLLGLLIGPCLQRSVKCRCSRYSARKSICRP